jgi:hypothetical protein
VIAKKQLQKNMSLRLQQKTVAKNTGKKSAVAKKPVQKKLHAMKLSDCN